MALTAKEREALLLTRKKVEDCLERQSLVPESSGGGYICFRLDRVGDERPDLKKATDRLKKYVQRKLGISGTLEHWQSKKGISLKGRNGVQDRLAWIDWMLDQ